MFPFALIFGAIGAVAQIAGAGIQAKAAADQSAASARAEKLRERQMNLESARQRREVYRQMLRARSAALLQAGAQGASQGSGLAGGLGQITGKTAENLLGINQAQTIGQGIFKANTDIAAAGGMAAWGSGLSSIGQTIGSLKFGS